MSKEIKICEFCGAEYDGSVNSSCPGCGGRNTGTKGYTMEQLQQERAERKALEQQKFNDRQKELDGQVRKIKTGCFLIVLAVIALIFFTSKGVSFFMDGKEATETASIIINNIFG